MKGFDRGAMCEWRSKVCVLKCLTAYCVVLKLISFLYWLRNFTFLHQLYFNSRTIRLCNIHVLVLI